MHITNDQIRTIRDNAILNGDHDLATLADNALESPCARAELSGQLKPCSGCGNPIQNAELEEAQRKRVAAFAGVSTVTA